MDDLHLQAAIAFLFPMALQLAKRSQSRLLQWVNQNRPKVSVALSVAASLATNMGLTINHTAHSVTISWVDLETAVRGLLNFALMTGIQFAAQHVSYEGIWRHVIPTPSPAPAAESAIAPVAVPDPTPAAAKTP